MSADTAALLACPFCGSTDAVRLDDGDSWDFLPGGEPLTWAVVCDYNRGGCGGSGGFRDSQKDAIAAWNQAADRLAALEAELATAQAEAREKSLENSLTETGTARLLPNGRLGCLDCGAEYGGPRFPDLVLPHDVWAKISPNGDEGGLLCPCCINARLAAAGISNVFGRFVSGPLAIDPDPSAVVDLIKDAIHLAADAGKSPIHAKLCEALDLLAIRDVEVRELKQRIDIMLCQACHDRCNTPPTGLFHSPDPEEEPCIICWLEQQSDETVKHAERADKAEAEARELRAELARVRELPAKWRAAPQNPDEPLLAMAADELDAALSRAAERPSCR